MGGLCRSSDRFFVLTEMMDARSEALRDSGEDHLSSLMNKRDSAKGQGS